MVHAGASHVCPPPPPPYTHTSTNINTPHTPAHPCTRRTWPPQLKVDVTYEGTVSKAKYIGSEDKVRAQM